MAPSEPPPPVAYGDRSNRRPPPAPQAPQQGRAQARRELDDIDDPFGGAEPLPSFPLEAGPESAAAFDLVERNRLAEGDEPFDDDLLAADTSSHPQQFESIEPDAYEEEPEPSLPPAPPAPVPAAAEAAPPPAGPELEEALEEAEFFVSRGLYEDAKNILREQLERLPKHPLLRERLAELEAQEREVKRGSGTRERPSQAEPLDLDADRAFDIAASLDALEQSDHEAGGGAAFQEPDQQVDVEEVFAKFKEGVAKQISVDDAQSHYDLGVAYKEMGLLEDAVREFEVAARDAKRECVCRSMIETMIQIEAGKHQRGDRRADARPQSQGPDPGPRDRPRVRGGRLLRAKTSEREGARVLPKGGAARPGLPRRARPNSAPQRGAEACDARRRRRGRRVRSRVRRPARGGEALGTRG